MSDVVIRAEKLGKKYVIGHEAARERYTALRDVIGRRAKALARTTSDLLHGRAVVAGDSTEEFWALKNVDFEVRRGEIVGVIGRNGAGKSTLLKILSRITEPTSGQVEIRGRVASLLEVGTGFHPELTGRENIYLNGAILGMARAEIRRKFDEIVAFAEVEKFLDTPVKRYSSGMYVRLAFAVAAHLEPEILLVDEVLAVGDAEFQRKCLGKIGEVSRREGRTVFYVSHNLASIQALCGRCLLIRSGVIGSDGLADIVVRQYMSDVRLTQNANTIEMSVTSELKSAYVESIEILDSDGKPNNDVRTWDDIRLRVNFFSESDLRRGSVVIRVSDLDGRPILLFSTQPDRGFPLKFNKGRNSIDCVIRRLPLAAGTFFIGAGLAIPNTEWLDRRFEAGTITVHPKDVYGAGLAPTAARSLLAVDYEWKQAE